MRHTESPPHPVSLARHPGPATTLADVATWSDGHLVGPYETAGSALRHQDLTGTRMNVTLAISRDEGMAREFASSRIRSLITRTLAMALHLDPTGTLAVVPFGRTRREPIMVSPRVDPEVVPWYAEGADDVWRPAGLGGCRLDLVLGNMISVAREAIVPQLLVVVLGGDPDYPGATRGLFLRLAEYPVFAKVIRLGGESDTGAWVDTGPGRPVWAHPMPDLSCLSARAYAQTLVVGMAGWLAGLAGASVGSGLI